MSNCSTGVCGAKDEMSTKEEQDGDKDQKKRRRI